MKFLRIFATLIIVLSPLYILRSFIILPVNNFYLPYTFLEVLLVCFFICFFIFFSYKRLNITALRTRFDLAILLLLVSAFTSVFVSYDFWGGLGILKAYFIEPIIFFYCLVFLAKKSNNGFILNGFILAGLWLSILAVIQRLTGQFSLAPIELAQGRVSGVYNSANALAMFLCPIIIITLTKFFNQKTSKKIMWLAVFLLFVSVIVMTRSRGGMVALVLSLSTYIYILLIIKFKILKKMLYVIPVALLLGLVFFMHQLYLNYNFFPIDWGKPYTSGDTIQIRYFLWAGTINLLKDHPINGAGLNGFKTLYTNQYRLPLYQEQFQYPHNLFLTFWAETGLYGLFSFLLIVVSAIGAVIRRLRSSKNAFLLAGYIAIISYWLIHGVVDVPYFKNDLSLEFWAVLALIQATLYNGDVKNSG